MLKVFDSLPYQSDQVKTLFPDIKTEDFQNSLHVIFKDGRVYTGSDAFRVVFLRMPLMFLIGLLMGIPPLSWILRVLYPYLAKNRYKLGGHCPLPTTKKPD